MASKNSRSKEIDALAKAAHGERFEEMNIRQIKNEYELHPATRNDPKFKNLEKILLAWINHLVKHDSAIIRNLNTDLIDGQTLSIFLNKLTGETLDILPAVSERSCRHNILQIVNLCDKIGIKSNGRWTVDGIVGQDLSSILYLLIDMAHEFHCPHPLPSNVKIAIVHTQTVNGVRQKKTNSFQLTEDESKYAQSTGLGDKFGSHFFSSLSLAPETNSQGSLPNLAVGSQQSLNNNKKSHDNLANQVEKTYPKDALDELFANAEDSESLPLSPAKLKQREDQRIQFQQLIQAFVAKNLQPLGIKITELSQQMHDGVYFIILIGVLGNFFVPLCKYKMKPATGDEKFENVVFALKLLESVGVQGKNRWNATDIVKRDQKMILRVLHDIFVTFAARQTVV